jgi:HD-like signal output (HDOD) protein
VSYLFPRFEQLKAAGALPSPSGVALEILRLTQSDDTQVSQLAHVLRADPALASRLIKFANSAQAAGSRPTVSISDAVKRLGFAVVRQLCLGFSVLNGHRDGDCPGFDYNRYWSRSLATALATQALTVRVKSLAPDESFTCGLLAEIGSLALASLHLEGYAQILQSGLEGAALRVAEREAFDVDHQEFSAALLEDWCLPRICVDAVFHSEQPERSGLPAGSRSQQLCEIIALSRLVGEYFVADMDARKLLAPTMLHRAGGLGIEAELLAQIFDTVAEGWQQWGPVLSVRTDALPRLAFGLKGEAGSLPAPQAAAALACGPPRGYCRAPAAAGVLSLPALLHARDRRPRPSRALRPPRGAPAHAVSLTLGPGRSPRRVNFKLLERRVLAG